MSQGDVAFYFQDEWKVSPHFTLSPGLRYENQNNISSNSNFAPRLSFAWSPVFGHKKAEPPKPVETPSATPAPAPGPAPKPISGQRNTDSGSRGSPFDAFDFTHEWSRSNFSTLSFVYAGGYYQAPHGINLNLFMIANSGQPFNITTGRDGFALKVEGSGIRLCQLL